MRYFLSTSRPAINIMQLLHIRKEPESKITQLRLAADEDILYQYYTLDCYYNYRIEGIFCGNHYSQY